MGSGSVRPLAEMAGGCPSGSVGRWERSGRALRRIGDDPSDQGWLNAWLVLATIIDRRIPQDGASRLGCAILEPRWGVIPRLREMGKCTKMHDIFRGGR